MSRAIFAYDYLKEYPQHRDALVKYNWAEAFNDTAMSPAVKRELLSMEQNGIPFNDTTLFFHKMIAERELTAPDKKTQRWAQIQMLPKYDSFKDTDFLTPLYSVAQNEPDWYTNIDYLFFNVHDWICKIPWTYDEMHRLIELLAGDAGRNMNKAVLDAICPMHMKNNWSDRPHNQHIPDIFRYMTINWLRTCEGEGLTQRLVDLFSDVDVPPEDAKFNSVGEVQRAHDARTERMVQEAISKGVQLKFIYADAFEHIVKEHGFTLPMNNADLIRRGKAHDNCVGTYAHKITNNDNGCSRLFYTSDATLELTFEMAHNMIVSTKFVQYKGKHNTNHAVEEKVSLLRIALTGLAEGVIYVTEDEDDQNQVDR